MRVTTTSCADAENTLSIVMPGDNAACFYQVDLVIGGPLADVGPSGSYYNNNTRVGQGQEGRPGHADRREQRREPVSEHDDDDDGGHDDDDARHNDDDGVVEHHAGDDHDRSHDHDDGGHDARTTAGTTH